MMRMTDPLTAVELPEGGALCAVSGGLDSMCLLEMTVRQGQKQGRRVAAAHFNHQLRGAEADRDEAFVRDWCAAREIPFFAGRGDVRVFAEETGRTVEEAARQLRYKFLEETRRREGFGCILTAHHADDSAETMLLNLLRGTGLKGLTGIPEKRDCILRPLLGATRAELAAYAAEHRIPFVEDSTNGTDDAARNMLRHQVLPVLKKLNPRVVENMSRTASLLAADEAALDAACRKLLAQCAVTPNVSGMIPLAVLQDAPEALRGRLVLAVLAAVVLSLFAIFYRKIFSVTFDETFARATGEKVERYNALLAFLTAITVVLGMRVMGAMLISSLIVFPGLTAMRVFKSFRKVLLCALAVSVVCFFAGLCASFALSVPTGASVVVANVAVFLLFSLIGKLRKAN